MTPSPNPEPAHLDAGVLERLEMTQTAPGYRLFSPGLVKDIAALLDDHHRRGVKIIEMTEWAGAHLVRAEKAEEAARPEPQPAEGEAREFLPSALRISSFEVNAGGKARMLMADDGYSVAYVGERTEAENHAWAELIVEAVNARLSPATQGDEGARRIVAELIWNWRNIRYAGEYHLADGTLARADTDVMAARICDRLAALTRPTTPSDEAVLMQVVEHTFSLYCDAIIHGEDHQWTAYEVSRAELDRLVSARASTTAGGAMPNVGTELSAIRALGWTVAVHNDYRLDGRNHSYWLFTKGEQCRQSESPVEDEALALSALRQRLGAHLFRNPGEDPAKYEALVQKHSAESDAEIDGAGREAELEAELAAERHDLEAVCHEVSLVYDHVTGGLVGKPNTMAFEVIALADDHYDEIAKEYAAEEVERALNSDELREAAGLGYSALEGMIAMVRGECPSLMEDNCTAEAATDALEALRRAMAGKEGGL